jgi:hypothetical protein
MAAPQMFRHYFLPGQIVFHVARAAGSSDAEAVSAVQALVNTGLGEFAAQSSLMQSINEGKVQVNAQAGEVGRATVVVDLGLGQSPEEMDALVQQVNALQATLPPAQAEAFSAQSVTTNVIGVSLNWLMSGAQGAVKGVGGPGAYPVEVANPTQAFSQNFNIEFPGMNWTASATPQEINIVVLDTAPQLALLAARLDELVIQRLAAGTQHPVLHRLLGSSKNLNTSLSADGNWMTVSGNNLPDSNLSFRVSYNLARDPNRRLIMEALLDHTTGVSIEDHDYPMGDHGLFAAGNIARLIQMIDPRVKVNLHLVQVLSEYGVGTLETLEQGLSWALASGVQGKPLVINCSLMLTVPRDAAHTFEFINLGLTQATVNTILATIAPSMALLEAEFGAAAVDTRYSGVNIVAAAGNDGIPGLPPPAARYPAAFASVMGVAAQNVDMSLAPYSNLRDDPFAQGSRAFGGEVEPVGSGWRARPDTGLIGLYLGLFPTDRSLFPSNQGPVMSVNGWGAWAGTSFASPRVAAALGLLRANGLTAAAAAAALAIP